MTLDGHNEVRVGISSPSLSCACLQYVLDRYLNEIPGVYDLSIIPPEMSSLHGTKDSIIRIFCTSTRLPVIFTILMAQGFNITSLRVMPISLSNFSQVATTVYRASKPINLKQNIIMTHLGTISGIVFSGIMNNTEIVVIHDEALCSQDAVRSSLRELVGAENETSDIRYSTWEELRTPTLVTLNSLAATLFPHCWVLDKRLLFFPTTLRSVWTVISGVGGFISMIDANNMPNKTLTICRKLFGFVTGIQLKNALSFILLFVGLFSVFLAALINHEFSPRYALQCISYSNFILASLKFYETIAPRLRALFLASVRWRGNVYTSQNQEMQVKSIVTYRHGDIVEYDCVVVQTSANTKISPPPFNTTDSPTECLKSCSVGQILYQGQQVLSGEPIMAKILRTNQSVSQILNSNSQSSSVLAPHLVAHRPYLKLYVRYSGFLSFGIFLVHWLLKMAFDPANEYDTDEFLLDAVPRVTLNAAIICQCVSSTLFYDSVDLVLIYVKQLLARNARVIVSQTVDLLRLIGVKRVVLDVGSSSWITAGLITLSEEARSNAACLEISEAKLADISLAPQAWNARLKCYAGANASYLTACESLFGVSVEVVGTGSDFRKQVELFRSLLPTSWGYSDAESAVSNTPALWVDFGAASKARLLHTRVCAILLSDVVYPDLEGNELVLVKDLKGLISLLYWSEAVRWLTDRASKLALGYVVATFLIAYTCSTCSHFLDGFQLWTYTLMYCCLTNAPLLNVLISLSADSGLLTRAGLELDGIMRIVKQHEHTQEPAQVSDHTSYNVMSGPKDHVEIGPATGLTPLGGSLPPAAQTIQEALIIDI